MKKCFRCKNEKSEENFTKRKSAKDGFHPYCKECTRELGNKYSKDESVKKRSKEWKKNNLEKVKETNKKSYEKHKKTRLEKVWKYNLDNREKINERQRLYNEKNRDRINERERKFLATEKGRIRSNEYYHRVKEKFDIKIKARNNLRYAVRTGKIMKPSSCEKCFEIKKLQGHHEDYDKPLEVLWVCNYCHKQLHRKGL